MFCCHAGKVNLERHETYWDGIKSPTDCAEPPRDPPSPCLSLTFFTFSFFPSFDDRANARRSWCSRRTTPTWRFSASSSRRAWYVVVIDDTDWLTD